MNRFLAYIVLSLTALSFIGCEKEETVYDPVPTAPQGVYSVTGNNTVYIYWNGPYERDVESYIIWRSYEEWDNYRQIGAREADDNPDKDLIIYEYIDAQVSNDTTYYYAVSSVDHAGQVSELSAESVFDTPRPDGEITFFDEAIRPESSGFYFRNPAVVPSISSLADVYIDRDINGVFYLNAANLNTEIQGMGYTSSFDDIGWAPQNGWSANGWAEIVSGHTYVIAIRNDHGDLNYAKMRVLNENSETGAVTFQWAYQPMENNPELVAGGNRPKYQQ
ncbi:MAG: hypothetical protein U9R56_06220 [candidate division Zixibacteria bacterium]|nr:hypothetical protein [candidate division Zixibacteria bacterium]